MCDMSLNAFVVRNLRSCSDRAARSIPDRLLVQDVDGVRAALRTVRIFRDAGSKRMVALCVRCEKVKEFLVRALIAQ